MSTESHSTGMQNQAGTIQQSGAYNDRGYNPNDPSRNGTPRGPPSAPPNSVSPVPSAKYAPLTSANFSSPNGEESSRSNSTAPGQAPSPAPSGGFAGPGANSPNHRAWSPQAGGPGRLMGPNGSTTSFGAQNAPKLSVDTNSRTASPLSVRNGAPMPVHGPAPVNHQQIPSIPSLHTPSADPARFHPTDASLTNPSHINPSQQSTSYHTAPQVSLIPLLMYDPLLICLSIASFKCRRILITKPRVPGTVGSPIIW